jgi:hypothetical protein
MFKAHKKFFVQPDFQPSLANYTIAENNMPLQNANFCSVWSKPLRVLDNFADVVQDTTSKRQICIDKRIQWQESRSHTHCF